MDNMDKYLGKMLDNRYEILEVIGSGGMAVVYKALCHRLNRHVAIKVLRDDLAVDAEFRRRFQTESQAVAMLSHPNIVSVYDVSRSTDVEYIVMELIEGLTLKQYMKKRGALGWKEALHFATQITKALIHAHSRGIIHRDIKPHNVMVVKDGSVKVADFGIARLQDTQNTMTQTTLGSVHYISPEQAKGEPVDARTDIYSLGIIMYEMLTGVLPFDGESAVSIALAHINSFAVPPGEINPEIPMGLEAITMMAMNPYLDERYESATRLLEDLEEFRKTQVAIENGSNAIFVPNNGGELYDGGEQYVVTQNVRPITSAGELSNEKYKRRSTRSKKVSMLLGIACVLVFAIIVFVFLWQFWLKDLFDEGERITMPSFVGEYSENIVDNDSFTEMFTFTVIDENSTEPLGVVIRQTPEAERSILKTSEPIAVTLYVSAGIKYESVPNLVNEEYRTAQNELKALGFVVEVEMVDSATITKDYVVSTDPAAGTQLATDSTVILYVSGGPKIEEFAMPNLIGLTETTAKQMLESYNLSFGGTTQVNSNSTVGTVCWQSVTASTNVKEYDKIYIQISLGPAQTPEPETSDDAGDATE